MAIIREFKSHGINVIGAPETVAKLMKMSIVEFVSWAISQKLENFEKQKCWPPCKYMSVKKLKNFVINCAIIV